MRKVDTGYFWKSALAASALILAVGCSSTSSSAPFHMYSSPLIEGEMEVPNATSHQDRSDGVRSPGVEPRQVYVYQRWHPQPQTAPSQRFDSQPRRATSGGSRRAFDRVVPPSEPVLANYDAEEPQPVGAGQTSEDTGASHTRPPTSLNDEHVPTEQHQEQADPSLTEESEATHHDPAPYSAQFIHTVLAANDIEFSDSAAQSVPKIYRECRSQGDLFQTQNANIGDLVFFHNTYDRNDDGRNNDWYTLVGVIENIHSDGTIDFLAHRGNEVETLHLNLSDIEEHHRSDGGTLNSKLRHESDDDAPFTQYLAGQLFAGFCNILGERSELVLIDDWSPAED